MKVCCLKKKIPRRVLIAVLSFCFISVTTRRLILAIQLEFDPDSGTILL